MLPSSSPALGHPGPAQPAAQFTATDCPVSVPVSGTPVIMGLNQVCHGLQNCEFFANPVLAPTKLLWLYHSCDQYENPAQDTCHDPTTTTSTSKSVLRIISGSKSTLPDHVWPKICHVPAENLPCSSWPILVPFSSSLPHSAPLLHPLSPTTIARSLLPAISYPYANPNHMVHLDLKNWFLLRLPAGMPNRVSNWAQLVWRITAGVVNFGKCAE